jgi:hypothetical protein
MREAQLAKHKPARKKNASIDNRAALFEITGCTIAVSMAAKLVCFQLLLL